VYAWTVVVVVVTPVFPVVSVREVRCTIVFLGGLRVPGVFPGPRVLWSWTFVTIAGRGVVDFRGFPGVYLLWELCGLLGDSGVWLSAWLGVSVGVGGGGVRSWRYRDLFDYVGDGSAPALPANFLG
jgi:hypothetical protein